MKITIIGFGGAGKSTLARNISERLNLPLMSLDRIWIETCGHFAKTDSEKNVSREKMADHVHKFIEQENWVSEGFYRALQPTIASRADIIILLEIPLYRRVYNHIKRVVLQQNRHSELSFWEDLLHVFTLIKRNYTNRQVYESFKGHFAEKIITLKSYSEVGGYLESL